jgi:predicted N-acetyltransferase YhbS
MEIISYQKKHYFGVYHLLKEEGWISFIDTHKNEYQSALENSLTFVAIEAEEVVGFIRAITDGIYLTFIGEIVISKDHRNKHIGSKLIHFLENHHPTSKYELICDEPNFYHKIGFTHVGLGQRKQDK